MSNRIFVCLLLLLAPASLEAQQGRPLSAADMQAWKSVRASSLSNDGNWFAYQLAPNDGEAEVVLRATKASRELRFQIGEPPAPVQGPGPQGGATAAGSPLVIAANSRFAAFHVYPSAKDAKKLKRDRKPSYTKLAVVNLASGEKKEFEKIRRFAFAGEQAGWIAMQGYPPEGAPAAPAPAPNAAAAANRVDGTDLLLYNLATGEMVNVGNVAEFAFDFSGDYLAYTIDARDRLGNGVQLRTMKTDVVKSIDSDRGLYRRLAWADSGPALAVLRGIPDSAAKDTTFTLVSFTGIDRGSPAKKTVDAKQLTGSAAGMQISADRTPRWAEDFSAVYFGIRDAKKKQPAALLADGSTANRPPVVQAGAPGAGGAINQPIVPADDENSSLILWHWKDPRLQSQQIVQEQQDKTYSYLSEYRLADDKVIRLADDELRTVSIAPKDKFAYGIDNRAYQQVASYNGRNYQDIYTIDLKTGERKRALQKHLGSTAPSPDGTMLLYFGMDTSYHVLDMATGATRNITRGIPAAFGDTADDHNNLVPPPFQPMGWSSDGSVAILTDGWDAWKVAARGSAAPINLTGDGLRTGKHYQRRYVFDPREKGIDLSKPMYFATYGEWTKKEGLARVDARRGGATNLVFEDAKLTFLKARDADVFLFTRQTYVHFPDYHLANAAFGSEKRLTDANPQQSQIAWSPGARLIDYVSAKGDKLQGTLYLPSNYQPGKKYPMLVTIYEKRSQNMHAYAAPNETRAPNPILFTNKGYVVFDPDIVYKVNDPGMSAVWSVIPAVKAAIATGIVDSANVGLWGHSWGGYQTAFLVTQTDIFKSAIAGAPLTDMVSMYSSIYWNTGSTNQGIFESSQGRFKGNFTDNTDAYIRNSPVFHAKNVKTPLIILHNDKDGAVDFNQGVTYYNTLRQLGKEVIMLEYAGENHGLARPTNQKDYAARMGEWFDHYLEGAPAPEWMKDGIPRIRMEDHLRERKPVQKPEPPIVP